MIEPLVARMKNQVRDGKISISQKIRSLENLDWFESNHHQEVVIKGAKRTGIDSIILKTYPKRYFPERSIVNQMPGQRVLVSVIEGVHKRHQKEALVILYNQLVLCLSFFSSQE